MKTISVYRPAPLVLVTSTAWESSVHTNITTSTTPPQRNCSALPCGTSAVSFPKCSPRLNHTTWVALSRVNPAISGPKSFLKISRTRIFEIYL